MPDSRVLLHIPGRSPKDALPGWPARLLHLHLPLSAARLHLPLYSDTTSVSRVSDLQGPKALVVNVSTVESFVHNRLLETKSIALSDGLGSVDTVAYISAVVNERVNFETVTESLICVSQMLVGQGWSGIQAGADMLYLLLTCLTSC